LCDGSGQAALLCSRAGGSRFTLQARLSSRLAVACESKQ
jgi:hypothetical protein